MTIFQELDAYLSQDFSDDYWYDDASLYACELVKQLTIEDWNALLSSWQNRSKQWQVRCAEILDWGEASQAVPLLLEMIREGDDELTLTAADSLRSIGVAELDLPVGEDVLERLQAVAQTGNIAKRIISELLKQLEVKAYRDFLIEVLQATEESSADPQVVYPLLEANLDKLDDKFAQSLRSWATAILPRLEPEQAQDLAAIIGNFSNLIQEFRLDKRPSNLEIGIAGYEIVATVFTRQAFPQEWATTQNNLGHAYLCRIRGERAENLEAAIHCYDTTLEVSTCEAFPHDWATIQNNLGNAYLERLQGEKVENLEAAIRCFLAALQVFTREAFPHDWATIQNNLGIAYRNRIRGERAKNLEAAIRCFLAALQVRTRQAFPQNYAETQFNLGLAYQDVRQLPNAYSAFATAIDTVESLRDKIVSGDEAKQKLAEEWNPLYQGMVEVSLELHDYAQAIKYVERSEAGNLVELLARHDFYPEGKIPADIPNELNRLRQEITSQLQPIDMEVERRRWGILTWKTADAERNEERSLIAT